MVYIIWCCLKKYKYERSSEARLTRYDISRCYFVNNTTITNDAFIAAIPPSWLKSMKFRSQRVIVASVSSKIWILCIGVVFMSCYFLWVPTFKFPFNLQLYYYDDVVMIIELCQTAVYDETLIHFVDRKANWSELWMKWFSLWLLYYCNNTIHWLSCACMCIRVYYIYNAHRQLYIYSSPSLTHK